VERTAAPGIRRTAIDDTPRSGTRRAQLSPPAILLLLLCAGLIATSVVQAQPLHRTRPLVQVTSQQWQQAITRWTAYPAGSWVVHSGNLRNGSPGRKFCGPGGDRPNNCAFLSLIAAPYHIPTTRYAVEARMRFGGVSDGPFGGLVLLSRMSSAADPWLFVGTHGIFGRCGTGPVLIGTVAPPQPCGLSFPSRLNPPIWNYHDGNRWHVYRLEVRDGQYRLFIDGRQMEVIKTWRGPHLRPPVGRGTRFGFYLTSGNTRDTSTRLWVKSLTITSLPASAQR
jgi:hypothetical protein